MTKPVLIAGAAVLAVTAAILLVQPWRDDEPEPDRPEWGVSCSEPSVERSFVNENLEPRVFIGTTGDGLEGPRYVIPGERGGVRVTLCVDPHSTWEMRPVEEPEAPDPPIDPIPPPPPPVPPPVKPPARPPWGVRCVAPLVSRSFVNENADPRVFIGTTGSTHEEVVRFELQGGHGGVRITLCVDPAVTWELRPL